MLRACGVEERLPLDLLDGERLDEAEMLGPPEWRRLLLGEVEAVRLGSSATEEGMADRPSPPKVVFPGAFNPLHAGHRRMVEIAREEIGRPVELEISILNVDKPPLDYLEIARCLAQFAPGQAVWLDRSATFVEKSQQFPEAVFVVGADTLRRIADPRYYGNDSAACRSALERIAARGCRFLVFGRSEEGQFVDLGSLSLPETLRNISTQVTEERFREDVSSTEIRRRS